MAPFIGEIRMFGGNFPPNGWMFCEGQLLPISENETLFNLIGTTYGGDGQSTFALPNLSGRVPLHAGTLAGGGQTFQLAESAGTESVTLTTQQIPIHNHGFGCRVTGGTPNSNPANAVAGIADLNQYNNNTAPNTQMGDPLMASNPAGGSQPHENCQPFLVIDFIISLFGIFPQQN